MKRLTRPEDVAAWKAEILASRPPYERAIVVTSGTCGQASGSLQIIEALRNMRAAGAQPEPKDRHGLASSLADSVQPLEECLDSYWQKGSELDQLEFNPTAPEVQNAV